MGAPRIHGELLKLGISVSEVTVSKYMTRSGRPPSPTWHSFLENHARDIIAVDFFTVPTATFRVLFVLVILGHDRRKILHANATEHPPLSGPRGSYSRQSAPTMCHILAPRSRCDIRCRLLAPGGVSGTSRRHHRTAVTVAKPVCRARDRVDSPECLDTQSSSENDIYAELLGTTCGITTRPEHTYPLKRMRQPCVPFIPSTLVRSYRKTTAEGFIMNICVQRPD